MSYLFTGLLLVLILDSRRKGADIFSPVRTYLGINFLALAVSFLRLNPAFTPFRLITWVVLISSSIAFVLGNRVYVIICDFFPTESQPAQPGPRRIDWRKYLIGVVLLNLLFIFCFLVNASIAGGVPAFQKNPGLARMEFMSASYLPTMVILAFPTIFAVSYTAVRFAKTHTFLRVIAILLSLFSTILIGLTLNRGSIIWMVIWVMLIEHYLHRRIRWHFMLIGVTLFILVFVGMATLRDKQGTHGSIAQIGVSSVYSYFANNYWNLDHALVDDFNRPKAPHTFGLESLSPMLESAFLNKIRKAYGWESVFNEKSTKVKGLNTISYQYFLYKEYGWPGIILFPFLVSFILAHIYRRCVLSKSLIYCHSYILGFYAIFSSIFIPIWSSPYFWVSFMFSISLAVISKRSVVSNE